VQAAAMQAFQNAQNEAPAPDAPVYPQPVPAPADPRPNPSAERPSRVQPAQGATETHDPGFEEEEEEGEEEEGGEEYLQDGRGNDLEPEEGEDETDPLGEVGT
jgi:hypothetical protein